MSLITSAPPQVEPFVVDDLRGVLSLTPEETEFDDEITTMIASARARAEAFTRRRLITQTVTQFLDAFPHGGIALRIAPVQDVSEVRYIDPDGAVQTLAAAAYKISRSSGYEVLMPAFGHDWPATRSEPDAVEIDIIAGYGDAGADVPDDILRAMKMDIAHLFEHRESVASNGTPVEMPIGSRTFLEPHRAFF